MMRRSLADGPLSVVRCPLQRNPRTTHGGPRTPRSGFTLVEMLIAMAITLIMIGAVVALFANVSNSVRNRRAVVEVSGQLRHARNMLQQDLQGATCPGLTWQRPDDNLGYIEIVEGPFREGNASALLDEPTGSSPYPFVNGELDRATSIIPASNLPFKSVNPTWATDGGGLGDHDDILMLTVRNEHEPFVGRAPTNARIENTSAETFVDWTSQNIESPLAEVIWYAVENPDEDEDADGFFGEPGLRTIYRRALLIAPWLNPYRFTDSSGNIDDTFTFDGDSFTAKPGLLRILGNNLDNGPGDHFDRQQAIASLIALQERFDISAHLEWDPLLGSDGRWKIVANTLGDLTKRENRYEHFSYRPVGPDVGSKYPFAVASVGSGYAGDSVEFVVDPEIGSSNNAAATAVRFSPPGIQDIVVLYQVPASNYDDSNPNNRYPARPFVFVEDNSDTIATARAMLNAEGRVVRVIHGLAPLSGDRLGEDVMLTDALGFDLRVFDPGAPLFGVREDLSDSTSPYSVVLEPTDPAWWRAYEHSDNMDAVGSATGSGQIGNEDESFPYVGQGAYVDLGYGFILQRPVNMLPQPSFASSSAITPWFFNPRAVSDVYGAQLAPGYAAYDTWSFHYENNGVNEDRLRHNGSAFVEVDTLVDEGTNGMDDPGSYADGFNITRSGPDDVGERETGPPYDRPLRGLQAVLRLYERDSRQIRQVTVNQNFVPE